MQQQMKRTPAAQAKARRQELQGAAILLRQASSLASTARNLTEECRKQLPARFDPISGLQIQATDHATKSTGAAANATAAALRDIVAATPLVGGLPGSRAQGRDP